MAPQRAEGGPRSPGKATLWHHLQPHLKQKPCESPQNKREGSPVGPPTSRAHSPPTSGDGPAGPSWANSSRVRGQKPGRPAFHHPLCERVLASCHETGTPEPGALSSVFYSMEVWQAPKGRAREGGRRGRGRKLSPVFRISIPSSFFSFTWKEANGTEPRGTASARCVRARRVRVGVRTEPVAPGPRAWLAGGPGAALRASSSRNGARPHWPAWRYPENWPGIQASLASEFFERCRSGCLVRPA